MENFETILDLALSEELGKQGDITSSAIFREEDSVAKLYSKDSGILAGSDAFLQVMRRIDSGIECSFYHSDGDRIAVDDLIAEIKGKTVSILKAERTAINIISFLSGIATKTRAFVETARDSGNAVILDTRKTLPGYRKLSKYAVRAGGGENHRMGLYDMVLIKDNHITAAGGIGKAVDAIRKKWDNQYKIEIECRNINDVKEALDNKADMIMLDNMDVEECGASLALPHEGTLFEASGNMSLEKVSRFSSLGLDFISVGELTHSVKAFDFSLLIPKN